VLPEPWYNGATGFIHALKPADVFGGGELVLCMEEAHLFPVRLEAPRVLGFQMTIEMGSKEEAE